MVHDLAERCSRRPGNDLTKPSYEVTLGPDLDHEIELDFRGTLSARLVPLYHATRLLPHELESVRADGLLALSTEHRSARLDLVLDLYGDEVSADGVEQLRADGPLQSPSQREVRLGKIDGATPLRPAFEEAGYGLGVLLETWGGEAINFIGRDARNQNDVLRRLSELSTASIVEVATTAAALNAYTYLWKIFVGQLRGSHESWHQFHLTDSVPAERVLDIITPASPRWPDIPRD